jgi:radical SAM-linked protein
MAPDSTLPAPIVAPDSPPRAKFRVRFCKSGDLRLVSHHDLMHVFERMFRRADLPIPTTQGFNPRPRMWFALSLALGIAGINEVLEFEVAEPLSAEEVERRLIAQCPPGLVIVSLRAIDVKASAHVRRGWYRVALPRPMADLPQRCQAFLECGEHWVERVRPQRRRINIRPYVDEVKISDSQLALALWITPNGAARPEEIIAALGLQELLDAGAVIERTDLEIYDELPPGVTGPPVMQAAQEETGSNDGTSSKTPVAARPTAIIDSPFSFDS